ncbi:MAG: hypothetical protein ACOYYS_19270 [Chloroflexota bacterium]
MDDKIANIPCAKLFEYIAYISVPLGQEVAIYDTQAGQARTEYVPGESTGFGFVNKINLLPTYGQDVSEYSDYQLQPRRLTFLLNASANSPADYWSIREAIAESFSPEAYMTPEAEINLLAKRSYLLLKPKEGGPTYPGVYLLCYPERLAFSDLMEGLSIRAKITFLAPDPHFYSRYVPNMFSESITSGDHTCTEIVTSTITTQKPSTIGLSAGLAQVVNPKITVTHANGKVHRLNITYTIPAGTGINYNFANKTITTTGGVDITNYMDIDSDFNTIYFLKNDTINVKSSMTQPFMLTVAHRQRWIAI